MKPPIIFLDFEGVLLADGAWSSSAIAQLNQLCHETGAAVVLSTSLRYSRSVEELHAMMLQNGFSATISVIGETRDLSDWRAAAQQGRWLYGFQRLSKGEEIVAFLGAHPDMERFVIIDDQPHTCAPYGAHTVAPTEGAFSEADRLQVTALLTNP